MFLASNRGLSFLIGSEETTSQAAAATFPLFNASLKSSSSIKGPLEVLIIITPSFILEIVFLLIIPWVDGVNGQ